DLGRVVVDPLGELPERQLSAKLFQLTPELFVPHPRSLPHHSLLPTGQRQQSPRRRTSPYPPRSVATRNTEETPSAMNPIQKQAAHPTQAVLQRRAPTVVAPEVAARITAGHATGQCVTDISRALHLTLAEVRSVLRQAERTEPAGIAQ